MQLKPLTASIYAATALATSAWCFVSISEPQYHFYESVVFFLPPLVFAFAYARAGTLEFPRLRPLLLYLSAPLVVSTIIFCMLATPFPRNPLRDNDSSYVGVIHLVSLIIILVSAVSLLIRRTSSLSAVSLVLLWPSLFLQALLSTGRFFSETSLNAAWYFLCYCSPLLIAFAAGLLPTRPGLSHAFALIGCLFALPWHYRSEFSALPFTNSWIAFNIPDNELGMYPSLLPARLSILSAALLTISLVIAILRLLPAAWQVKKSSIRDWNWPAPVAAGVLLSIWLCLAASPYRIPGALDRSHYPVFEILHIEKDGLQFHEKCISFYDVREGLPPAVSSDERRLLQYRFQLKHATATQTETLISEVASVRSDLASLPRETPPFSPLRAWNSDAWYVSDNYSGLFAFTTQNGKTPPANLVALFRAVEQTSAPDPINPRGLNELKDICLGFCFDQFSAMGSLYSNHRCNGESCR